MSSNPITERFYKQWKIYTSWITGNLNALSDEELKVELVPGKNHGVWILGHLIESEDDLSKYLGKGDMLFPEYEQIFGQGSTLMPLDKYPSVSTLREQWKQVLEKNDKILSQFKDEEWEQKQALYKEGEDNFFTTKGSCIMIWNLHQAYHHGQLAVLLSKAGKTRI